MEKDEEDLHEVVKDELLRLGIQKCQNEVKKSFFFQNGSRLLEFTSSYLTKSKVGNFHDSPMKERLSNGHISHDGAKTPSFDKTPKSPFLKKNRLERRSGRKSKRKIIMECKEEKSIFGCDLESMDLCSTQLSDGLLVYIPEFIIDAGSIIKKNLSIEGLFRKAGSAQRQNELKKVLNSGKSFPLSVHPVDAACLLKQFLRSLPTPLLSHHIHFLMTRCLELPMEERREALSLCSLLLAKPRQDLLAYILELLSCVSSRSSENLMDAHNLAIVIAPNLLSQTMQKNAVAKRTVWTSEDHLLFSTIDVIQVLIDEAPFMCRPSEKVCLAVKNKVENRSTENLVEAATGNRKLKRRSASIHRFVNGIRRVVQGTSSSSSSSSSSSNPSTAPPTPSPTVGSTLTPAISSNSGPCFVSMTPDIEINPLKKPSKRKSDPTEFLIDRKEENMSTDVVEKKKARIDLKATKSDAAAFQMSLPGMLRDPKAKNPKAVRSMVTVNVGIGGANPVARRRSLYEKSNANHRPSERRKSFAVVAVPTATVRRVPSRRNSRGAHPESPPPLPPPRKSFPGAQKEIKPLAVTPEVFTDNRPDGSEAISLGPRGIPDGAESIVRPPLVKKSPSQSRADRIQDLEKRYDEIKSAVTTMEKEMDERNLNGLKKSFLSARKPSDASGVSLSELIMDAYERMKVETRELDCSPSENLSRRLGKELRIRRRRSDEHRVLRSPSERRIGTIRRRSKELEQQQQNNASKDRPAESDVVPLCSKTSTPKLKGQLLLSSPQVGLRRGKPNSLKSGLPVVVSSSTARETQPLRKPITTSAKTVCISKRRPSSKDSLQSMDGSGALDKALSPRRYSGGKSFVPARSPGSVMASPSNLRFSPLNLAVDPFDLSGVGMVSSTSLEEALGEGKDMKELMDSSFSKGCTLLLSTSGKDLSELESSEWVPSSQFLNENKGPHSASHRHLNDTPVDAPGGNRPSIAALSRQRKVTTNVRLFSQLGQDLPHSTPVGRRSTRYRQTPKGQLMFHRSVNPEGQHGTMTASPLPIERSPSTPLRVTRRASRNHLEAAAKSSHWPGTVISPLRERNRINPSPNAPTAVVTPRIKGKESGTSKTRRLDADKVSSGLTPLPPRPYKPTNLTPKATPNRLQIHPPPPMLPPRSDATPHRTRSCS